jgi:hypothetical protein
MFVIAELGAELPGSGIILGQFRSYVASCRNQRAAKFDSRHEFARVALGACRQQPKEFDDATVMTYRLTIGRAPDRHVARFLPPLQRDFGQTGVGVMVGENFRLCLRGFGKMGFQSLCDLPVKLFPFAPQECLIGGIAHECVLEHVSRSRRCAVWENKLGSGELGQCVLELRFAHGGHRCQQGIGELATDRGTDLCHLLDRCKSIQPRHERILQRCRNGKLQERLCKQPGAILLLQQS